MSREKNSPQYLSAQQAKAILGGGEKRIEKQHQKGKLTARERIDILMDEGSFEEIGQLVTHRSSAFGLDKQKYLLFSFWWNRL